MSNLILTFEINFHHLSFKSTYTFRLAGTQLTNYNSIASHMTDTHRTLLCVVFCICTLLQVFSVFQYQCLGGY